MYYKKIEISRDLVRDELFYYLRENRQRLSLSPPPSIIGADRSWVEKTKQVGLSVNELINEVYKRLISSEKANSVDVSVNDSTIANAYEAYYPLQIKILVIEEIFELVREGILIGIQFRRENGMNFNFEIDLNSDKLMLTKYGIQFMNEEPDIPYFWEGYFDRLRKFAEPDEELKGYLTEGLTCLRNHLGRASALLLRLAAEHTLTELIDSRERGRVF